MNDRMQPVETDRRIHRGLDQRGISLLGTLLASLILSVLGSVSLTLAVHEIQGLDRVRQGTQARYLAEAAMQLVIRQVQDQQGPWSRSPFAGTAPWSDVLIDASRPDDDRLLNGNGSGWFHALRDLGRVESLRIVGANRLGVLGTVEVTVSAGTIRKTLRMDMLAHHYPALTAGLQVGQSLGRPEERSAGASLAPALVHWGDVRVKGDLVLSSHNLLPARSALAEVSGRDYGDMLHREDQWTEWWIGGSIVSSQDRPDVASFGGTRHHSNLHVRQESAPGVAMDVWDYETWKRLARRYGTYYVLAKDGLLYPDGGLDAGMGRPAEELLLERHRDGRTDLLFIDTPDQQPPVDGNLIPLTLPIDYLEGVAIVNAHVRWIATGKGRAMPVLTPPIPTVGTSHVSARSSVDLPHINLKGVLSVAGDLMVEGRSRVFGGVMVQRRLWANNSQDSSLEIWYDDDLRHGLVRGLPLVSILPGSLREVY